ncbi:MAG: histidinol-phosphatase [Bacillota bacterium]|jgi:histidinol-phosphatase (PHP family)|nr:histidinol-phosphatase [Bacillota bacterium]NLV62436.1 histidinol-phosphatase [Clostridiaceae bacterium]
MLTTYHTHSYFCDGSMHPEDYVRAAVEKGFTAIGFSSHAPVLFETDWNMKQELLNDYIETILRLKEKYKNRIQVYTGLETDYYPNSPDYRCIPGLDYTIGAIHFIYSKENNRYMALDGTPEEFLETLNTIFDGDVEAMVKAYYSLLTEMISKRPPDIAGHIDILKKNNAGDRFFSEKFQWYRLAVETALNEIKNKGIIVEVNTGGISRGYTTEVYPSVWIMKMMREMEIPVVLNSDAHNPDWIDAYYEKALTMIKSAGYTTQRVLIDGVWQDVKL